MKNVSAFLAVALTMLTGAVEAQMTSTDCTRVGNTLSCTTIPLGPASVPPGPPSGGGVGGAFVDSFLRAREQASPPVIIIQPPAGQPPAPPAATLATVPATPRLVRGAPLFDLGGPNPNGLYPLRWETDPGLYELTVADVRGCMADTVCGSAVRQFISLTGLAPHQIGIRP